MHFRVAYNWDTNYERDNRDTYELSSLTKSEVFGELPPDYEAGYVDSLSNRSHSRTMAIIWMWGLITLMIPGCLMPH